MKTEPVEEFCKNDAAPVVRECPDCIDKFMHLARRYEAENFQLREEVSRLMNQSRVDLELCRSISEARDVLASELDRREQTIKLLHTETQLNIDKRKAAELQIERWKKYAALLGAELNETATIAHLHHWRSTRFEEGKRLRAELEIPDPHDAEKKEGV
jgi:hypothetical protein